MNATDWEAKIAEGQARVAALRARLAAGEDEATAAHAEGFATRNDITARIEAIRTVHFGGSR